MLADASLTGILSVWGDLVKAYHGINSYGSVVAEIYEYCLRADSPMYRRHPENGVPPEESARAVRALEQLLELFAREYECKIYLVTRRHDHDSDALLGSHKHWCSEVIIPNGHRYHIRVERI